MFLSCLSLWSAELATRMFLKRFDWKNGFIVFLLCENDKTRKYQ